MNKLAATFAVGLAAFSTALIPSKEVSAALTEPSSYDYAYKYDAVSETFLAFGDGSPQYSSIPFTRTADGAYYNYSYTGTGGSGQGSWPFEITMTFNRSTTNWDTALGGYEPYATTYIGSNNSVGAISYKISFEFDNNTSHDYKLKIDISSTSAFSSSFYQTISNYTYGYYDSLQYFTKDSYNSIYIPAFSNVKLYRNYTSDSIYFNAWYLQDLGVSDAYTNGYDYGNSIGYEDGYADGLGNNPNILLNGFETVIGIFVNFILMIATFDIFGISIMNILLVFVSVIGLVWILKVLRG
jgi:hypothetical protein